MDCFCHSLKSFADLLSCRLNDVLINGDGFCYSRYCINYISDLVFFGHKSLP